MGKPKAWLKKKYVPPVPWSAEQEALLMSLRNSGYTFLAIGEEMGKSMQSVQTKYKRLIKKLDAVPVSHDSSMFYQSKTRRALEKYKGIPLSLEDVMDEIVWNEKATLRILNAMINKGEVGSRMGPDCTVYFLKEDA